jgi:cysteine rich repeat protein
MIRVSAHAAALWAIATVTASAMAFPAFSQAPTDAQRSAIRSACRSDYVAHCSSVPPGGMASLQCLQKNMSSLSSSCKAAVNAIEAPAEPKADAKPETKPDAKPEAAPAASTAAPAEKPAAEAAPAPAPKAAASTAAKKPSSAQAAAIRSACRSDYMAHCASVPTGGAAALNCLKRNKSNLSANCQQAVNAAGGGAASGGAAAPAEGGAPAQGGAAADTATAAPDAAPAAAPMALRSMRPREVLFVLRSACGADVRALCGDVPPGGGRIVQCLAAKAASLSPACHDVLGSFAQ